MVMATLSSGITLGSGKTYSQITQQTASIVAKNTQALETGKSIVNARSGSASVAASAQALANQTGGNILGFTYE